MPRNSNGLALPAPSLSDLCPLPSALVLAALVALMLLCPAPTFAQGTFRPFLGAAFVRQSVPATTRPGERVPVTIAMRNTGGLIWTGDTGIRLGTVDDAGTWLATPRVELPGAVAPGQEVTFSFEVTAPATPGTYAWNWRMLQEYVTWFGDATAGAVSVATPPLAAAFVRQSVPSTMQAGARMVASVTMRNTGGLSWTREGAFRLGTVNDLSTWLVSPRVELPNAVAPGQEVTFTFDVVAPAAPNTYTWRWGMLQEYVAWFGDLTAPLDVGVTCVPSYGTFGGSVWPSACWRPYSDSAVFNTPLPANPPLVVNSSAIRGQILGAISKVNHVGFIASNRTGTFGEPTYYSRQGDPEYVLHCGFQDPYGRAAIASQCGIDGKKIRIPAGAMPEGGIDSAPINVKYADRHMTIVDQSTDSEFNLWQVWGFTTGPTSAGMQFGPLPNAPGHLWFSWGGRASLKGDGTVDRGVPGQDEGSANAAHFGELAGRLRLEELRANRINHALAITVWCTRHKVSVPHDDPRVGDAVFPARGSGQSCGNPGVALFPPDGSSITPESRALIDRDAPPLGARLFLNMDWSQIEALRSRGVPDWKLTTLRALKEYGAFIIDTGGDDYFDFEVESGLQYKLPSPTAPTSNPWFDFGAQNWDPFNDQFVGKFLSDSVHRDTVNWDQEVWQRLEVVDQDTLSHRK
jgi:hypothetical protein